MTKTPAPHHLVGVWNPSYARNAMEEHLALLLSFARACDNGSAADDDVYVWWGKVRSENRQTREQGNEDDLRALDRVLQDENAPETHLYLTDYRSLYVADVIEIREGDLPDDERAHAPSYYFDEGYRCDFWFRLADVRRLVRDDLNAVIESLRALRNTHYGGRPVSLYGGMVNLPLIVTRPDLRTFFSEEERDHLIDGRLWAEFDAESGEGIAATERALRDDLIGERAWNALELMTRVSIASGEQLYREHRHDLAFDFGGAIGYFSKALEVQCNTVLRSAMPMLSDSERLANVDGRTVDLRDERPLSAGQLARAIGGERALNAALASRLENGRWFAEQLPAMLDAFANVRNPGTHAARIDRATATHWRNRLLGVGCVGDFVELAKVRVRDSTGGARIG